MNRAVIWDVHFCRRPEAAFLLSFCMLPRDTHLTAYQVQVAAYRALSLERRAEIAAELTRVARGMAREGIRLRHPSYTEAEVTHALLHLLYDREVDGLAENL